MEGRSLNGHSKISIQEKVFAETLSVVTNPLTNEQRPLRGTVRTQYPTLVYPKPSRKMIRYNEALDLRLDIRELEPPLATISNTQHTQLPHNMLLRLSPGEFPTTA